MGKKTIGTPGNRRWLGNPLAMAAMAAMGVDTRGVSPNGRLFPSPHPNAATTRGEKGDQDFRRCFLYVSHIHPW